MKGSAPKLPATGSHVCVRQKSKPNFRMESIDSRASSAAMPATMRISRAPKAPVPMRNPVSPERLVERMLSRGTRAFQNSGRADLLEGHELQLDNTGGQRRIAEVGAVLLTVGERPFHEVDHGLRLGLVLGTLVEQEPGERRDGIHALAGSVRDRHAEIGRHVAGGAGRRG